MKIKNVAITLGLSAFAALAVGAGLKAGAREAAKADTYSGTVTVNFEGVSNWGQANAKVSLYLYNESVNPKKETFVGLQSFTEATTYTFSYNNLDWQPVNMIVVRHSDSTTEASWDNKWNQTGDLNYSEYVWVKNDLDNPEVVYGAQVRSNNVESFGRKQFLTNYNSLDKEWSGSVTLAEDEEFKILNENNGLWSGYYDCPAALSTYFSGGSKVGRSDDNPNIVCEVAGTYNFFFKRESDKLWITRQDIVDADKYAADFLKDIGCDPAGVNEPTGWATVRDAFALLTNEAKKVLCTAEANVGGDNIARCVFWYDRALVQHTSLVGFMSYQENANVISRSASSLTSVSNNTASNNATIVIVVLSSLILLSAGGFFFIRKRKEDK